MKITLCTFTRTGAEAELGPDLAATVRAALCDYSRKLRSGREPIAPPQFRASVGLGKSAELELAVDPDVEAALEREATRQGIALDALATHSVLVYLAELDLLTP
jgi:predicted HicB family RNase H-like nuclease